MLQRRNAFDEAMIEIYRRAKSEAHYTASVFLNMVMKQGGARGSEVSNQLEASVAWLHPPL